MEEVLDIKKRSLRDEYYEICEKIQKIEAYINDEDYSLEEKNDLYMQLYAMQTYRCTLKNRCLKKGMIVTDKK